MTGPLLFSNRVAGAGAALGEAPVDGAITGASFANPQSSPGHPVPLEKGADPVAMTLPHVVGLGSHHGDDQAGWLVVDRLSELGYPASRLRKAAHPADLLDDLSSRQPLVLCDACQTGGAAGAIHRWRWPNDDSLAMRSRGTHDLPLEEVLALAREMAEESWPVDIWGIDGADWSPASDASSPVQAAARDVAREIWSRYHA